MAAVSSGVYSRRYFRPTTWSGTLGAVEVGVRAQGDMWAGPGRLGFGGTRRLGASRVGSSLHMFQAGSARPAAPQHTPHHPK